MAKFEMGRVYFENFKTLNNGLDLYIEEIEQVISRGITDTLFICDDVYFRKDYGNQLCNLFISINGNSDRKVEDLIEKIWREIIFKEVKFSDILKIGIWKSQYEVINEINSNPFKCNTEEFDEQLVYRMNVSDDVINYIKNNSFDELNRLQWFDFTLYSQEQEIKLNSSHSGHYVSLYNLNKHKVDSILTVLDGNFIQINIMPLG